MLDEHTKFIFFPFSPQLTQSSAMKN